MPSKKVIILSEFQRNLVTDIVWRLSCERDWMNGKKIPRHWCGAHHIRHDSSGSTTHTDNRLINFACLTINGTIDNNARVERNWSKWEKNFIIAWDYFKKGLPPPHWRNKSIRRDFLEERKKRKYLDNWISILEKNNFY